MSEPARLLHESVDAVRAWEPAAFDTCLQDVDPTRTPVALPTLEQVTEIQESAHREGYEAGHAEGLAAGLAEGRRLAEAEARQLMSLSTSFREAIARADEAMAQTLLDLALDLTHALTKASLAVRPERVLPIVREAVRYMPIVQSPARLYLSPADRPLVERHLGEELARSGWHLADDPGVEPGGCRVETASNQIDATLPTRWKRLVEALGRDTDWIA